MSDSVKRLPILGCIADDVTGATDLAINLVQGGMKVVQVLGVPEAEALAAEAVDCDAIVIALKSRSMPAADAIEQSATCLRWLQSIGVSRFYFKYCSTFDSTVDGNIGPVAEALMQRLGVRQTVFCPAFPRAGRTVYQGHLFVGKTLLHESGMQNHPLNPMTDSNLVRFLSTQTTCRIGLLDHAAVAESAEACEKALSSMSDDGVAMVITDVVENSDLVTIADAVGSHRLVTGGSGLGRYLPETYRRLGLFASPAFTPTLSSVPGRSLILSGSCSARPMRRSNGCDSDARHGRSTWRR